MNKQRGFTLIELLVVVSIIGMLASVVIVAVRRAKITADEARVLSDLRSISTGLESYYNDHGHYPVVGSGAGATTNPLDNTWAQFRTVMAPYMTVPYPPWPSLYDPVTHLVTQSYGYYHVEPPDAIRLKSYDLVTGLWYACTYIYDGYYMSGSTPGGQTYATKNDGGPNPNGIDKIKSISGRVENHPLTDCPTGGIEVFTPGP